MNIGNHKHKTSVKTVRKVIQDVGIETFEKDGEQVTVAVREPSIVYYALYSDITGSFHASPQFFHTTLNAGYRNQGWQVPNNMLFDGRAVVQSMGWLASIYGNTLLTKLKNRATPEVVRAALEFTPSDPRQRANEINRAFKHFDYANSHFLVTAGIEIRETPEMIKGRMLGTPSIVFGTGERNLVIQLNNHAHIKTYVFRRIKGQEYGMSWDRDWPPQLKYRGGLS